MPPLRPVLLEALGFFYLIKLNCSCLVSSVIKSLGCACLPSRLATCAAQVQSWVRASGLAGFDGHAMRSNSQAAMEDLSVSERFRAVD